MVLNAGIMKLTLVLALLVMSGSVRNAIGLKIKAFLWKITIGKNGWRMTMKYIVITTLFVATILSWIAIARSDFGQTMWSLATPCKWRLASSEGEK